MNNELLFLCNLVIVLFASILVYVGCALFVWLACIFLLIVCVPLLFYFFYKFCKEEPNGCQ